MSAHTKESRHGRKVESTGRVFYKNLGTVVGIGVIQLIGRGLALLPLWRFPIRSSQGAMGYLGLVMAVILYILIVPPLRCWGGESMRRLFFSRHQPSKAIPYERWMHTGLARYGRGLLWGLPFLAACAYCILYLVRNYDTLSATDMWRPVQNLPTLIGLNASLLGGLGMTAAALLLLGLLFAYGWWRDLPVEYLPVRSLGAKKTYRWAGRIRRHHGNVMRKTTLFNILLCLPAAAGAGAALWGAMDLKDVTPMSLTAQVQSLPGAVTSQRTLLILAAVFLLLYFPFCLVRKMRNAALVARLMKGEYHQHEEGGHAAG